MSPPGTEWDYMVQAMNAKPSAVSRFKGCLIGGAVGDALGAPVEFMSLAEIRRKFGPDGITGYSPAYSRIGAITDDTQMTLWTAEGLLRYHCRGETRGIVPSMPGMVHRAYLRWLITRHSNTPTTRSIRGGCLVLRISIPDGLPEILVWTH